MSHPHPPDSPSRARTHPAWGVAAVLGAVLLGVLLQPAGARQVTSAETQAPILAPGGASADSNNRMIAVTGVDLTGQSVLYLVDTHSMQLACYQATGGAGGTQGVRLVGARRIDLDLMLDGFNDKTEDRKGAPLPYKALEEQFRASGLLDESR